MGGWGLPGKTLWKSLCKVSSFAPYRGLNKEPSGMTELYYKWGSKVRREKIALGNPWAAGD